MFFIQIQTGITLATKNFTMFVELIKKLSDECHLNKSLAADKAIRLFFARLFLESSDS